MNKFLISLEEGAEKASLSVGKLRKDIYAGKLTEPVLVRVGRRTLLNPDLFYSWLTEDPDTFARTVRGYLANQPGNSNRNLRLDRLKRETDPAA